MGKFKDRLKQITSSAVVRGALRGIPFGIGDMVGGVLDETSESKSGTISKDELIPRIIKIAIYGVLVYLALKGSLTWEQAETAKEFITP